MRGGKQYVDSLFEFSLPVGDDYSGEWADASTLVVTVTGAGEIAAEEAGHNDDDGRRLGAALEVRAEFGAILRRNSPADLADSSSPPPQARAARSSAPSTRSSTR